MRQANLAAVVLSAAALSAPAFAADFINGNFEDGTLTGWSLGGGRTVNPTNNLDAARYFEGGAAYNPALAAITVTTVGGLDAITGVSTVFSGDHAVRVNNAVSNYSVSAIKQTVVDYQADQIAFAWNAVLEASHDATDSDAFNLILRDETTGTNLVNRSFSSASAPGTFSAVGNWFTSGWRTESLDVSALKGHTFTLSLLATDCPYGAHAGYVYLDGFGSVAPPPGPVPSVPEPETYTLVLAGLGVVGFVSRRRRRD